MKTIALVCSSGGHLTQILQLDEVIKNNDVFLITEKNEISLELKNKLKVYYIDLINRKMWNFMLLFIKNFVVVNRYLNKERPDIIISTGALSAYPSILLGKLKGSRIIFIESFAKMKTPTITGRLVYRIADLFIIQWEALKKYYPKAVYGGKIY